MDLPSIRTSCDEYEAFESPIDTQYFGIPSAKVVLRRPLVDENKQDKLIAFLHGFEFVMIANKGSDSTNNRWLGERTKAFLVDINIQLQKHFIEAQSFIEKPENGQITVIRDSMPHNDQILHIADTYFKYSQFLNDPYLPQDKASRIYGDIVLNAFNKAGRFFVTTHIDGEVTGFLLFVTNTSTASATIQLIAVNQEFKRQGVGKTLIHSMESYVSTQNIQTVNVGTQFNNFNALKFYQTNGYSYNECSSIYHYWPLR